MSIILQNLILKTPAKLFSNFILAEHTLGTVTINNDYGYPEVKKLSGSIFWRRQNLRVPINDGSGWAKSRQVKGITSMG